MSANPSISDTYVRKPQQKRSRETLERVLLATETLLELRTFEEVSLSEILKRGRLSVGAFYARFSGKDALVPLLYERYDRRLTDGVSRAMDPSRWADRPLADRVRLLIRYAAMLYRRNRGLMRALALHARTHPEAISALQRENRSTLYDKTARILLECRAEMTHPDPDQAVRFGLLLIGSTLREKILFSQAPHPHSVATSDSRLAHELSRAFLGYVGHKE